MSQQHKLNEWFREAKQSLSVAGPICIEANELVVTSRKQIEEGTVLWAQVIFFHDAIEEQLGLLQNVQSSFEDYHRKSSREFGDLVNQLAESYQSLDDALKMLDETDLDPELLKEGSDKRNLRSFVFESGIDQLRGTVEDIIYKSKTSEKELGESVMNLASEVLRLRKRMYSVKDIRKKSLEKAHGGTEEVAGHAHAMAELLESLTRHYDQCLKAIELTDQNKVPKEEIGELLQVLENDSYEVEGAVNELHSRRQSIEVSERSVSEFCDKMGKMHIEVVNYFKELDTFTSNELREYLKTLDGHSKDQSEYATEIAKLVTEVNSLVDYYNLFYKSYHSMVLEIVRRSKAQAKMESLVQTMLNTINSAYNEEVEQRRTFLQEHGDFLPSDLWEGLTESPGYPEIGFDKVDIPKPSEKTIQAAMKNAQLPL
ncbi:autophagy-related protein 17 [Trichomonascus vanleenenianus]|uniref:protein kinase regulatory subunit ATG17 n=1 Tax=Trichomonascus vanleenenianus TaxID=2268995 RepID=UPI003EC9BEC7